MARKNSNPGETQVQEELSGVLQHAEATSVLLRELVAHLRQNRTQLRASLRAQPL